MAAKYVFLLDLCPQITYLSDLNFRPIYHLFILYLYFVRLIFYIRHTHVFLTPFCMMSCLTVDSGNWQGQGMTGEERLDAPPTYHDAVLYSPSAGTVNLVSIAPDVSIAPEVSIAPD